jgi:hypothetical protein
MELTQQAKLEYAKRGLQLRNDLEQALIDRDGSQYEELQSEYLLIEFTMHPDIKRIYTDRLELLGRYWLTQNN